DARSTPAGAEDLLAARRAAQGPGRRLAVPAGAGAVAGAGAGGVHDGRRRRRPARPGPVPAASGRGTADAERDAGVLRRRPAGRMGELLARELEGLGFRREGAVMVRERDGVTTTVDPRMGTVTVEAKAGDQVKLEGQREGTAFDDVGPGQKRIQEELRQQLQ